MKPFPRTELYYDSRHDDKRLIQMQNTLFEMELERAQQLANLTFLKRKRADSESLTFARSNYESFERNLQQLRRRIAILHVTLNPQANPNEQ